MQLSGGAFPQDILHLLVIPIPFYITSSRRSNLLSFGAKLGQKCQKLTEKTAFEVVLPRICLNRSSLRILKRTVAIVTGFYLFIELSQIIRQNKDSTA